jgi:hypothetical protein
MPLHVIAQRNTKIDSNTKERLINEIIDAYPEALTEAGGVGKRTPLHIIFTGTFALSCICSEISKNSHCVFVRIDYVSARLTKRMVDLGAKACFMKDKHGYLPAHVACRRHTSPDKLRMLLTVNPGALYDRNNDGRDLLALAEYHATKSHPNYALIEELKRQMKTTPVDQSSVAAASVPAVSSDDTSEGRERLDSSEVYPRSWPEYSNGGHHEYGCDDRHHGPYHNGAPQGPYEPLVVSYQTLHETHGPADHRHFAHAPPRLQTFQYDQRDLAPIPYSPSGASAMVSGSHGTYETVPYHQHEAANPEHRDNGAERFHFIDHGGRIYRDPAPYYSDQGHGRPHHHHRNGAPPTFRRHYEHHHTEQPSMHHHHNGNHHLVHHRGMDSPTYTTQIVKHQRHEYHEQPRDNGSAHVSNNTGNRFSRHIETFMEVPAPAYNGETFNTHSSPRFADLSPHSTDVVAEFGQQHPPKPTVAPSNGRKRKGHFFRDDEPNEPQVIPDVQEAAGASLLLHFSRQSGHDSADEKSPEEMANDADGKKGYKGADLLFEV